MRSRADPVRAAFSRGVPGPAQTREPRKPRKARPILWRPNAPGPSELPPSELPPSELPREDAPRSQPRPGDFGLADPRSAPVSRATELLRENRGVRPASPPPAERIRLPRCRRGDDRPRDADRPTAELRPRGEEDRLNTEPPSRDRPMLELAYLAPPSPERRSPEPPGLALPRNEPASTPSRRLLPNLTLDAPAPWPSR